MVEIQKLNMENVKLLAPLVADFRVELRSYKGISSAPNISFAEEELKEYLQANYPVFMAIEKNNYIGYIVCRVEEPTVWVESIFVRANYRRMGVAKLLFQKAEKLAESYGENTVFNYVHPNNDAMIGFLRKQGYTVLNLIEIRKPFINETLSSTIRIENNIFDY